MQQTAAIAAQRGRVAGYRPGVRGVAAWYVAGVVARDGKPWRRQPAAGDKWRYSSSAICINMLAVGISAWRRQTRRAWWRIHRGGSINGGGDERRLLTAWLVLHSMKYKRRRRLRKRY